MFLTIMITYLNVSTQDSLVNLAAFSGKYILNDQGKVGTCAVYLFPHY